MSLQATQGTGPKAPKAPSPALQSPLALVEGARRDAPASGGAAQGGEERERERGRRGGGAAGHWCWSRSVGRSVVPSDALLPAWLESV